ILPCASTCSNSTLAGISLALPVSRISLSRCSKSKPSILPNSPRRFQGMPRSNPIIGVCNDFSHKLRWVVLENSNVEKLASNQYLLVQSRSKEDRYDINDASAGEVYSILVPESTVSLLQSSWHREHR